MASDLTFLDAPLLPRTLRNSASSGSSFATSRLDEGPHDACHSTYFLTGMDNSKQLSEQISAALTISRTEKRENCVDEEKRSQHQLRRKGLVRGRKMTRFSMDTTTRTQEPENMKSLLKDKHIAADPEEYFATIKRNELAERELKKLMGELDENPINDDVQRSRRQRRPGLSQRRTSVKHFSSMSPETSNTGILKPIVYEEHASPRNYSNLADISQVLETATSKLHDFGVPEADKENMGKNPIDVLLSACENLDDREGVALVQDFLQLKPTVLDKLHLPVIPPDTPDAQAAISHSTTSDFALPLLQKPNLHNDTLLDLNAWSDTWLSEKPSDSAKDGFSDDASPHHIDVLQPDIPDLSMNDTSVRRGRVTTPDESPMDTNTCLTGNTTDGGSGKTGCRISVKSSTILRSKEKNNDMTLESSIHNQLGEKYEGLDCETTNSVEEEEEECHRIIDRMSSVNVNLSNRLVDMEDEKDKEMHELEQQQQQQQQQQEDMQPSFQSDNMILDPSTHNQSGDISEDYDCRITNPIEGEECHWDTNKMTAVDTNLSNAVGHMKEKIDVVMNEESDRPQAMQDQSSPVLDTASVLAGSQENSTVSEEHDKQIASRKPKETARRLFKRRMSRGKSLAGGGTTWDCGLRRSTRMKFRPLEHWRGERLLYGRIHDSLATVIGVKCSSPGGNSLKVKSYVSDEFAELVETAGLH